MPVVQRYGDQKVRTDALPGVRKTAAETPDSMGAGLAEAQGQTWGQLGRLAGTVGALATDQIAQARKENDDLANLAAANALAKASSDITTRALEVKGKDALALPDTTKKDFDTAADAIEGKLANDDQRAAFARVRSQHDVNLYATVGRHLSNEMQSYRAEELKATIDLGESAAAAHALDPGHRGKEEHERVIAAMKQQGPLLGWGPAELADRIAQVSSAKHITVIKTLVDNNQTANAKIYFEETQHEIAGEKRGDIQKLLNHGNAMAEGLAAADTIIAKGGTRAEQLKAAAKLDPAIREHAEQRIEHVAALRKADAADAEEHLLDAVYTRLHRNRGDLRSVTATEQEALGKHLPAIKAWALSEAKGEPTETDQAIYYMLKEAATTDPKAFLETNLLTFKHKLSNADFQELAGVRGAIRAGTKPPPALDDWRTEGGIVKSVLERAGLDATPKDDDTAGKQRVAQFSSLLAAEARRVQEISKKPVTHDELEAIGNRILGKQIADHGWFTPATRSLGTATPKDIPPAEMALILDSLTRAGQPTTPEQALAIWLKSEARKK